MNSPRSFRTTELAKEFKRQGHEVVVLTHKNGSAHASFEREFDIAIRDLGKLKWNGIEVKGGYLKNLFLRFSIRYLNKFF